MPEHFSLAVVDFVTGLLEKDKRNVLMEGKGEFRRWKNINFFL
jgi:hypothetical protein